MPQVRDGKTGRYTSGGGSSVGGAAGTNPRIQKAKAVGGGAAAGGNVVNEDANPEYRYHSTSTEAYEKIKFSELNPSSRGMHGKGVYFAYNVEGTKGWTSEKKEAIQLRVKTKTLSSKYGYDDIDNEQGIASKPISSSDIEVKTASGWKPMSKSYFNYKKKQMLGYSD